MTLWTDGVLSLVQNYKIVIVILVTLFGIGSIILISIKCCLVFEKDNFLLLPISLGSVFVPALFTSTILFDDTKIAAKWLGIILLIIAFVRIVQVILQKRLRVKKKHIYIGIFSLLLLLILIVIRLAYLQKAVFPSYSDSVTHYRIISEFFEHDPSIENDYSIKNFTHQYYHFGYHFIVIWMVSLFNIPIESGMLITGQFILILFSINLFVFIKLVTHNTSLALLSTVIASFCWQIPSFSINWGKYPALASLMAIPLLFTFIFGVKSKEKSAWYYLLQFLISILVILFHSRMLFVIISVLFSSILTNTLINRFQAPKIIFIFLLLILANAILVISQENLMFYYFNKVNLISIFFLFFIPFSVPKFPHLSINISIMTFFILVMSILPVNLTINHSTTTLIDDTFVTIFLCLPLGILIATGVIGFLDFFSLKNYQIAISSALSLIVLFSVDVNNLFYPHPCCNYLTPSNLEVINWIKSNIPKESTILISSTQMKDYKMGVDAGDWLNTLTRKKTIKIDELYPWSLSVGHASFCDGNEYYIYLGGMAKSFRVVDFSNHSRFQEVYSNGTVHVIKVIGCSND